LCPRNSPGIPNCSKALPERKRREIEDGFIFQKLGKFNVNPSPISPIDAYLAAE
jgi:hypothetical protein